MTPDERAARLHLTDAAAALRTASERLCDWLEATGQDVAGNGHVASADEATGSFREAPPSPAPSAPRRCRFVEADGTPSELYEWGANSPAPASAPRRWWMVVDCDGTPREAYEWDERLLADRRAAELNHTGDPYAPFSVVPVVEARVTRETVERVAEAMWNSGESSGARWQESGHIDSARTVYRSIARAAICSLGLTAEGDDHA